MPVSIPFQRGSGWIGGVVLGAALLVAIGTTRDQVGSWNDASRLATVECLVDYRTLAIDRSIYVDGGNAPHSPAPPGLMDRGTLDKLWIDGHFYSDKSPVPALLMAGPYRVWQGCTGLAARDCPPSFVWWMTVATSGVAFGVAVWCIFQMGGILGLPPLVRLALTASFGLATVAPVYAQQINNHVLLLAVTAALMLGLVRLARQGADEKPTRRIAFLGFLVGLGYTIDLGAGPVILACVLGMVVYRHRRFSAVAVFLLGAMPWLVLHHSVNYAIGGTMEPANAVPEYLAWPGSPFHGKELTGGWTHESFGHFVLYAFDLLLGKRGFLGHNFPLFLAGCGIVILLRHRPAELPEIVFAVCCAGAIWLIYAVGSNNLSGRCCSVRWLVPLLAPGYFVLAVLLRDHPRYWPDFLVLSGWGSVLTAVMACFGPWTRHMVPGYWFFYAAALLTWSVFPLRRLIAAMPGERYHQDGVDGPLGRGVDRHGAAPRNSLDALRVGFWVNGPGAAEERTAAPPGHDPGKGRSSDPGPEETTRPKRG